MYAPNHPRIAIDPGLCGGRPTVAGTRIAVAEVLERLADGAGEAGILADFPYLTREDVRACLAFAAAALDEDRPPAGYPRSQRSCVR